MAVIWPMLVHFSSFLMSNLGKPRKTNYCNFCFGFFFMHFVVAVKISIVKVEEVGGGGDSMMTISLYHGHLYMCGACVGPTIMLG